MKLAYTLLMIAIVGAFCSVLFYGSSLPNLNNAGTILIPSVLPQNNATAQNENVSSAAHTVTPIVTLVASNAVLDSGQYETLTPKIDNGMPISYTANFFNITGNYIAYVSSYKQWIQTTSYPLHDLFGMSGCIEYSNTIYCISGNTRIENKLGYTNSVYYSPILPSGLLGTWQSTNAYPLAVDGLECVLNNSSIYCIGGDNNEPHYLDHNSIYYAQILENGGLGAWQQSSNSYPVNTDSLQCTDYSNDIYCVGGITLPPQKNKGQYNSVYYAPILKTGGTGTWTETNSYPTNVDSGDCLINSSEMYCMGGEITPELGIGLVTNAVYTSQILPSGGVSSWQSSNNYPVNTYLVGECALDINHIFCTGGAGNRLSSFFNVSYYATVSSTGIGDWISTINYPKKLAGQNCLVDFNKLYCIGGDGGGLANSVYFAPLSLNGIAALTPTYTFIANTTANKAFSFNVIIHATGTAKVFNSVTVGNTFVVNNALTTPILVLSKNIVTNSSTSMKQTILSFEAISSGGTSPYIYNYTIFNSITKNIVANQLYTNVPTTSNSFSWIPPNTIKLSKGLEANVTITDSASTPVTLNSISKET